jgi:hypothetical protein
VGSAARLSCHRCGSIDLELTEFHVESHLWDGGLYLVDGRIEPAGTAIHRAGDILPQRANIRCNGCGHNWHPRRPVGMPYEPGDTNTGSNAGGRP